MGCFCTVIIIAIIVIAAVFIYCKLTGKTICIKGGHEVKHNGNTLHVKNFKSLKKKLREKYPEKDTKEIHEEADRIVNKILSEMPSGLGYHDQAKWIDEQIEKRINEL